MMTKLAKGFRGEVDDPRSNMSTSLEWKGSSRRRIQGLGCVKEASLRSSSAHNWAFDASHSLSSQGSRKSNSSSSSNGERL